MLVAQAEDLHTALRRVAADGWSHVILDGKLFDCERLTETTISVKGKTIDAWYSGKHRDFGANIQVVMRPDGLPVWTSKALPGHLHDLTCAQDLGVAAALKWAASELDLPTLGEAGYEGAGLGIKTPTKQPVDGKPLAVANRTINWLLRGPCWQGERGFALLVGRWKTPRHTNTSPSRTSDIVAAALHLTHFEYKYPAPSPGRASVSRCIAETRTGGPSPSRTSTDSVPSWIPSPPATTYAPCGPSS